jgi:hypothetical protein
MALGSFDNKMRVLQIRVLFILIPPLHRLRLAWLAPFIAAKLPAMIAVPLLFLLFLRLSFLLPLGIHH